MQIFLARNNVQAGPYTLEQLNQMLGSQEVSLDDLMWHEGMSQWQRLGDVTSNRRHYTPAGTSELISNSTPSVTSSPDSSGERVSLEQLYGKPAKPNTSDNAAKPAASRNPISLGKPGSKPMTKSSITGATKTASGKSVVLAPVMSRVLALAINGLLYLLSVLPLLLAYLKLNIDFEALQALPNLAARFDYLTPLIESIPQSTLIMSNVMMYGLLALQLIFIIKRGQSLGKILTGIRVVDQTTHTLPPLSRLLGIRALLLAIMYIILGTFLGPLILIPIALHYFMVSKSPDNIGWHDKLAKTLVVKANDKQLEKPNKK